MSHSIKIESAHQLAQLGNAFVAADRLGDAMWSYHYAVRGLSSVRCTAKAESLVSVLVDDQLSALHAKLSFV